MKILTKILNALVVIFVVIGIVSTVYYIREYFKPQIDYYQIVDSLQNELVQKHQQLEVANFEYDKIKQERIKAEKAWLKEKEILQSKLSANQEEKAVSNLPLDEMLRYILDYYNTDTTEANIIQDGDSIVIMVTPKLIHSVGLTIAENKDNIKKLEAYHSYVTSSDSLIDRLSEENGQLVLKNTILEDINKNLESINTVNKDVIDSKDAEIKKYKLQRNIIAVGSVVVVVLLVL